MSACFFKAKDAGKIVWALLWDFEFHVYIFSAWKQINTSEFLKCEEFESVSWSQFSGSSLMTRCWCCWTQRRRCGAGRRGLIQLVWPRGATCYPWNKAWRHGEDLLKFVNISANKDVKIQICQRSILTEYMNIWMRFDLMFKKSHLETQSFKLDCKHLLSILTLDTFFDIPSQAANYPGQSSEGTRMPLSMLLLLLLIHSNWKKCQELCLKMRSSWCPRRWRVHSSFRNRH